MLVFASAASVGVAKGYETYQSLLRIPLLVLAGIAATLWAVSLGMAISYARIVRDRNLRLRRMCGRRWRSLA